jgi:flagellar L-ring protein precursor FlgH
MKKSFIAIVLGGILALQVNAAPIYNLYNAHRAMRVDDILTVVIIESAKAGSQSGTNTQKQNDLSLTAAKGTGLLKFLPSFGASGSSKVDYNGQGATTREGSLDAKISARVIKVLDNGDLVIDGSKVVEINEEKEIIKVNGIVRPQDIEGNNIIYSYNIADAQITYSGKGTSNTGQRPGILARFLNWIF